MRFFPYYLTLLLFAISCTQRPKSEIEIIMSRNEDSILTPILVILGISAWFLLPTLWYHRKTIFRINDKEDESQVKLVTNPKEAKYLTIFVKITKYSSFIVLIFSSIVMLDSNLPLKEHKESVVYIDTEYYVMEDTYSHYYMDGIYTQNFFFSEIGTPLEKYDLVKVYASPIFKIVKEISIAPDNFKSTHSVKVHIGKFSFLVITMFILSLVILITPKKYNVLIFVLGVIKYLILPTYLYIFFIYS